MSERDWVCYDSWISVFVREIFDVFEKSLTMRAKTSRKGYVSLSAGLSVAHLFLGNGPDRRRSPVEWGDFPFVCSSVRMYLRTGPSGPSSQA